ncbi:hypothetical protein BZA77DRAFT_84508 [Pyronema omphalodes]|nr:hypothetical protein BZA77DRAFT_84508 [Pyronema omphalodes]
MKFLFLFFTSTVFAISISIPTAPRMQSYKAEIETKAETEAGVETNIAGMPPCLKCHNGGCCPYNWPICCLNSRICGKTMLACVRSQRTVLGGDEGLVSISG